MAGQSVAGYEYRPSNIGRKRISRAGDSRQQSDDRGSGKYTYCILSLFSGSSVRDVPVRGAPLAEQGRAIKRFQMPLCWEVTFSRPLVAFNSSLLSVLTVLESNLAFLSLSLHTYPLCLNERRY